MFSLKGIFLESQYFCLFESFVVSVFFFVWNLQAGFTAEGPDAPLRGEGAFAQVAPGQEVALHRRGLAGKGWSSAGHNLKLPLFPLRESRKIVVASCLFGVFC